jgi:hypothetical protein
MGRESGLPAPVRRHHYADEDSEIAIIEAARMQMEYGRATVEEGRPYTFGDDNSWALSRATGKLRDMAVEWSHFNMVQQDWGHVEVAKAGLGLPAGSLYRSAASASLCSKTL